MTSPSATSTIVHFVFVFVFFFFVVVVHLATCSRPSHDHGDIEMGVSNDLCDNGRWRLWVDWDNSTDYEYQCQPREKQIRAVKSTPKMSCLDNEDILPPLHKCMTTSIQYEDQPPRGGSHRPLWPIYGEYLYVPPQRWIHSLEHGGAVFLFHPCADRNEIAKLKLVAKSCLRRHVITPYRHLPLNQPLAIVTYGCKLTMSYVDKRISKEFIQENALNPDRAPEASVWNDGQYNYGLIEHASVVLGSDILDSTLCPGDVYGARKLVEENMVIT